MPDYGATPEARALRIRAGVMLPFWQRLYHLAEDAKGERAEQLLAVCRGAVGAMEIILATPDCPALESIEQVEGWAATIVAQARPDELAPLLRAPLRPVHPVGKPGPVSEFMKGAFLAWLRRRRDGEEISFCVDAGEIAIEVVTQSRCASEHVRLDEIPAKARAAGAQAVRQALKEVRALSG